MLDVALNPYLDAILREHVIRNARRLGMPLGDLEEILETEADAIEWLKEVSVESYAAYVQDSDVAVDHVGWIVTPKRPSATAE